MDAILGLDSAAGLNKKGDAGVGFNEFSEYIKRGPQKNNQKYGPGKNCKTILDSQLGNYT
jgi:hypothetical protein